MLEYRNLIRICFRIPNFFGSMPVFYNSRQNSFETVSGYPKPCTHKLIFHSFLIILLISGAFMHKRQSTTQDSILFWYGLSMHIIVNINIQFYYRKTTTLSMFLNSMLKFPQRFPIVLQNRSLNQPLIQKVKSVIPHLIFLTIIFQPFFYIWAIHWWNPCKPAIAGYWVLPECGIAKPSQLLGELIMSKLTIICRVVVLALNNWMWLYGSSSACVFSCILHTLSVTTICEYLKG